MSQNRECKIKPVSRKDSASKRMATILRLCQNHFAEIRLIKLRMMRRAIAA